MDNYSLLTPLGYQFSSCGYCKGADGSKTTTRPSYYCHGYRNMTPEHYESLANRMWRRSGTTYYKPDSKNACCPHYTIRLDTSEFKVTRNQKKVVNKFTRFVIGNDYQHQAAKFFPRSRADKKKRKAKFDVCQRIYEADWDRLPSRVGETRTDSATPAHKLEVTLESDAITDEKYALFAQYQSIIHKEPPSRISRSGFQDFLCSGLRRSTYTEDGKSRPIGSYHQCYRLDGELVAIGVLDLLPHAVSSVYLIYKPDLSEWEFGKLSALREIAMAMEYGYRYYYMGYYIHSCAKMRYKRTFKPTYVLDAENYEWMLFDDDLLTRFEKRKYVSLEREGRLGLAPSDPDPEEGVAQTRPFSSRGMIISAFRSGMKGLVPSEAIANALTPSDVPFYYDGRVVYSPSMTWIENEMHDPCSLLGRLAEFIACVGLENLASRAKGGLLPALDWIADDENIDIRAVGSTT